MGSCIQVSALTLFILTGFSQFPLCPSQTNLLFLYSLSKLYPPILLPLHDVTLRYWQRSCTHIHTHTRSHTYIHTYTRTHTYIHIHVHTYTYIYTYTYTYTHTHIQVHIHIHVHVHTYTYTYTVNEQNNSSIYLKLSNISARSWQGCPIITVMVVFDFLVHLLCTEIFDDLTGTLSSVHSERCGSFRCLSICNNKPFLSLRSNSTSRSRLLNTKQRTSFTRTNSAYFIRVLLLIN